MPTTIDSGPPGTSISMFRLIQQTEHVGSTSVEDDRVVGDECAARRQGRLRAGNLSRRRQIADTARAFWSVSAKSGLADCAR
jgi:hypothetical protein